MRNLLTLEEANEVERPAFNPHQTCNAVHPINGERCQQRGWHNNNHWAIYEGMPGITVFSQWRSTPDDEQSPVAYVGEQIYSSRRHWLMMAVVMILGAAAIVGAIVWLVSEGYI